MSLILNDHNKTLIDITFPNLVNEHKNLIINSLNEIFKVLLDTIFYRNEEIFVKQMKLNNSQDILGFIILLLPYFDFSNKEISLKIKSLDDIFKDPNPNDKIYKQNFFKSTYYLDHETLDYNLDNYKKYFYNNTQKIINTINKVKHKLLPNWLNIFPYKTSDDLTSIKPYINLENIFIEKKFDYNKNDLYIGYDTLYGTIANFLYHDIYRIKWMIYDYYENEKIYPSIIHICELLDLKNILIENYDLKKKFKLDDNRIFYKLSLNRQEKLINIWKNTISNEKNNNSITNLLLFYIRLNIYNIDKIKISRRCKLFFKKNNKDNENEVIDEIEENYKFESDDIKLYIKELSSNIEYADIYEYIYSSLHQFRYTWYGSICLDNLRVIEKNEYQKFFKTFLISSSKKYVKLYDFFSLKLLYNYFKSLIHFNLVDNDVHKYDKGGNTWDEIHNNFRQEFIERLNDKDIKTSWFNIPNNLGRIPFLKEYTITELMEIIREVIYNSNLIPRIIIITLIYNGILTEFKYNPELTNKYELPNKNKDKNQYVKYIKDRLKIKDYEDSFNFLSNTQYKNIPDSCENIKNSFWYDNFGGDWVAQIQIYHHFINQRFMIITAVTGAGKSTVIPFILLYALKILNYNNNCKLICTAPRIGPVVKNTKRISDSLGYRYQDIKEIDLETNKEKKKIKKNNINYIQF